MTLFVSDINPKKIIFKIPETDKIDIFFCETIWVINFDLNIHEKRTKSRILTRVGEMTIVGETETETAEKGTTEIGTETEEGTEG